MEEEKKIIDGGILKIMHKGKLTRIWFKGITRNPEEIKLDGDITELDFNGISKNDRMQLEMSIPRYNLENIISLTRKQMIEEIEKLKEKWRDKLIEYADSAEMDFDGAFAGRNINENKAEARMFLNSIREFVKETIEQDLEALKKDSVDIVVEEGEVAKHPSNTPLAVKSEKLEGEK